MPLHVMALAGQVLQEGGRVSERRLPRDMGLPRWVDEYYRWDGLTKAIEHVRSFDRVAIAGYSLGGARIASLSHYCENIVLAIPYESPLSAPRYEIVNDYVSGLFPCIFCWNLDGVQNIRSRRDEFRRSMAAWKDNGREFTPLIGRGRHTKWVWQNEWPYIYRGHNWDTRLNGKIGEIIDKLR